MTVVWVLLWLATMVSGSTAAVVTGYAGACLVWSMWNVRINRDAAGVTMVAGLVVSLMFAAAAVWFGRNGGVW